MGCGCPGVLRSRRRRGLCDKRTDGAYAPSPSPLEWLFAGFARSTSSRLSTNALRLLSRQLPAEPLSSGKNRRAGLVYLGSMDGVSMINERRASITMWQWHRPG